MYVRRCLPDEVGSHSSLDERYAAVVGGGKGKAYLELGVDNLDDDVLVGEPDHEPVLGGVVLVLGLRDKTLPGVVCVTIRKRRGREQN